MKMWGEAEKNEAAYGGEGRGGGGGAQEQGSAGADFTQTAEGGK